MDRITFYFEVKEQLKKLLPSQINSYIEKNKYHQPTGVVIISKSYVKATYSRGMVRIEQRQHVYDKWELIASHDYRKTTLDIVKDVCDKMIGALHDK